MQPVKSNTYYSHREFLEEVQQIKKQIHVTTDPEQLQQLSIQLKKIQKLAKMSLGENINPKDLRFRAIKKRKAEIKHIINQKTTDTVNPSSEDAASPSPSRADADAERPRSPSPSRDDANTERS